LENILKSDPYFYQDLKAFLFDLDGTLIDSAPDIAVAINTLLTRKSHSVLTLQQVRSMIGNGVKALVQKAFTFRDDPVDENRLNELTSEMMGIYADNLTNLTVPMLHAEELLRTAQDKGLKIALVTNKPEVFSRHILHHFGWEKYFGSVVGGDTCPDRKPAPGMLFYACAELGVRPETALIVGDSPADIDSAKNASMRSIAVSGGYTNIPASDLGADLVVNDLSEIVSLIRQLS
jgi:phosphoglycolate phosphatase